MKQVIFFLFLLASTAAQANPIKVDERIQKLFAEAFPAAQKAAWYSSETHYEVVFYQGDVQCRIYYRLNGTVARTERFYTEKDLAPFVLATVKGKYAGYKVYGVNEVTTEAGVTYHLILEGAQKWLHVRADDTGSSNVVRRIKKQAPAPLTAAH